MSISNARCMGVELYKRVLVLSRNCATMDIIQIPVTSIGLQRRNAHNNLFQMVKKRTLEARSKTQSNPYPNNKPILSNDTASTPLNPNETSDVCKTSTSITSSKFLSTSSKNPVPTSYATDKNSPKNKLSCNAELLKAPNCGPQGRCGDSPCDTKPPAVLSSNESKRPTVQVGGGAWSKGGAVDTPDPCAPSRPIPRGPTGDPGGDSSNLSDQTKLLLALAAAMGLGGLVWLLTRSKSKGGEPVKKVDEYVLKSSDLPKHVPYLLIGGGTASFSAFRAIKSHDARAKVLMITDEKRKPYMRPPLSKELWYSAQNNPDIVKNYRFKQWTGSERSLFFEPEEFFIHPTKLMNSVNGGIAVAHGFVVKKIDAAKRIATLSDGYEISYDECLIATGCKPKSLPIFLDAPPPIKEKVMVYRTPDDFEKLKKYVDENKDITIIGNGFIGSELACSLANYRKNSKCGRIYQVFPETGNMSKVLPDYLSKWTMQKVENQGVCVLPQSSVIAVRRDNSLLKLTLSTGDTIVSDMVCVCIGCEANTDIATLSGLEVDRNLGGFVVNAELEARRNLYVAGDASCFYDPLLGRRRVEHHDHSVVSGRLAGENMVGKKKPYSHQSMFWSDLGPEIGYEGIGLVDATLPTVGVFALPTKPDRKTDNLSEVASSSSSPAKGGPSVSNTKGLPATKCNDDEDNYGRGVIFYLKNDKIVGILLWNIFNRIGLARTIINQNEHYEDLNEVAKLFEIHS